MDFLAFSHLRWNFVFQRPQHLLSRFAAKHRVFFWEEPIFDAPAPYLAMNRTPEGVYTLVPHLPKSLTEMERYRAQQKLLAELVQKKRIKNNVFWYYTPMAIHFTRRLKADVVVYDCMDELSAFRGAPPGLQSAEEALFSRADLVFTGGQSLHKAKKQQHPNVYCFPSSIDREFFQMARCTRTEPRDQAAIPHPRLGYAGVIDERMDVELLKNVAALRPDWHFVMVGPVVKISEAELPKAHNIHWLGGKDYRALPAYMAGWEVGLLPFARNESTRYISPTKTPEYLAAGLSVVSTSIADVVRPYGMEGLVEIADDAADFVAAAERAIETHNDRHKSELWLAKVDKYLAQMSWDSTWARMAKLIEKVACEAQSAAEERVPSDLSAAPRSLAIGD